MNDGKSRKGVWCNRIGIIYRMLLSLRIIPGSFVYDMQAIVHKYKNEA